MKIALLTTDDRHAFRQYDKPEPFFGTAPEALLQGFAALPGVEVHVVSCTRQPVRSPTKKADNIWFHSVLVPKFGWMSSLYQGCIRAVRKKLREIRPNIVHGQGTELDCGISAAFSGFPNVITIHGNMRAIAEIYGARVGSFHWLAARLETLALRRTAGVFCNSDYTETLVGPRSRKTWRVANALRLPFFAPPAAFTSGPDRLVILHIGVLEPRKQQVELLQAARHWHECGLKFELQFIGRRSTDTDYGRRFARELAIAEATGYARHIGTLPTGPLIATLDAAHALIHFPTEEAFGLVVAEALARNLKFFGSNVGGVPDIAQDVESAELFAPDDWVGLGNAINRWIMADCPRPSTAAATMRERYHPLVIARRHLEIYQEVLSLKPEH